MLQTANAIATDENQNQCCAVKILLDPGSQQTFVTQRIVDELKQDSYEAVNLCVSTMLPGWNRQKSWICFLEIQNADI